MIKFDNLMGEGKSERPCLRSRCFLIFIVFFFFLPSFQLTGSEKAILSNGLLQTIKGEVVDEEGNPSEGVSVTVKRRGSGTGTDPLGRFARDGVRRFDTLCFRSAGYCG